MQCSTKVIIKHACEILDSNYSTTTTVYNSGLLSNKWIIARSLYSDQCIQYLCILTNLKPNTPINTFKSREGTCLHCLQPCCSQVDELKCHFMVAFTSCYQAFKCCVVMGQSPQRLKTITLIIMSVEKPLQGYQEKCVCMLVCYLAIDLAQMHKYPHPSVDFTPC